MMKESILRDIKKDSPSGRFATTQSSVRSNEMLDVSSHINKLKDIYIMVVFMLIACPVSELSAL